MDRRIPFNRAAMVGSELRYIEAAIANGQIMGDGTFAKNCHTLLQEVLGARKALLTTSCTHALEMTAILLRLEPQDEIIVPSFTFVSTANAFALHGARPVFIDSRRDTLNMDETQIENLITSRTRAILPVHYAGVACEMDTIMAIARRHNIAVIEDNAHGLFGKYRGKYLGTIGTFGTQSFHETKNVTCGEGGALLINDPAYVDRAEIIREKGTDRTRFYRGQVDKYTWVDIGSSYIMSDILAGFLFAQLEQWGQIQQARKRLWERYDSELRDWADQNGVRRPYVPADCEQAYHMYYLLLPTLDERQALITYLMDRDILAVFHYLPLHLSAMGRIRGGRVGDCPVAEDVSDRLLRLPFFATMTWEDQSRVIEAICRFRCGS